MPNETYSEGGSVCVGFSECRCARCIAEKRAKIRTAQNGSSSNPTPCPSCGLPTWDGLHRDGHRECDMGEVPGA